MAYEADSVSHGMHGAIGGVGALALAAFMMSRGESRAVGHARAAAAGAQARGEVLADTVASLRRELALALEENHSLQLERQSLRASVRRLRDERDAAMELAKEAIAA